MLKRRMRAKRRWRSISCVWECYDLCIIIILFDNSNASFTGYEKCRGQRYGNMMSISRSISLYVTIMYQTRGFHTVSLKVISCVSRIRPIRLTTDRRWALGNVSGRLGHVGSALAHRLGGSECDVGSSVVEPSALQLIHIAWDSAAGSTGPLRGIDARFQ